MSIRESSTENRFGTAYMISTEAIKSQQDQMQQSMNLIRLLEITY